MTWVRKKFSELTVSELYEILQLRSKIFVVEQNCIYLDIDGKDKISEHLYFIESDNSISAYCRLLPPGSLFREAAIGRIVVRTDKRGQGLSREMMNLAMKRLEQLWPVAGIRISGQAYLEKFYKSCGFRTVTDIYLEDGIDHVAMVRYRYAEVKYLAHSTFVLSTPARVILFDYGSVPDRSSWSEESCSLPPLEGRPLFVFSSHQHADHYISDTLERFPEAAFFLHGHDRKSELPVNEDREIIDTAQLIEDGIRDLAVYPHQQVKIADMTVFCSGSSDQGTAFLIDMPELTVLHAGDLARWDDLPQYKDVQIAEVRWLADNIKKTGSLNIAFLPVSTSDGYQEQPLLDGLEDTISLLKPTTIVPMHGYRNENLYDSFATWLKNKSTLNEISSSIVMKNTGQTEIICLAARNQ